MHNGVQSLKLRIQMILLKQSNGKPKLELKDLVITLSVNFAHKAQVIGVTTPHALFAQNNLLKLKHKSSFNPQLNWMK